jgi:UDP-3-O-[3-hydroxymyristoyl] glucosamine N-acyltransferase
MKKSPDREITITVAELAEKLGCPYAGNGRVVLTGVADIDAAEAHDLAYAARKKFFSHLETTRAAAVILPPETPFDRLPVIFSPDPQRSFVKAQELFFSAYRPEPGIHPLAHVSPSARMGSKVSIGAHSVVGDEVEIGDNTVVFPMVTIYPRVRIGTDCLIHSQVSLRENITLGQRVILHNGVVIGSDGFGYLPSQEGSRRKIPQQGTVIIEDDVEIGSNTTVDRGALRATVIRRGVKIDNLVQIAHNVEIGENSVIMAQVGIAGSSRIGKNVILAGQAGVPDNIEIGDNAIVAAKTGITNNIPANAMVSGSPHLDIRTWRKAWVAIPELYGLLKEFRRLKKKIDPPE